MRKPTLLASLTGLAGLVLSVVVGHAVTPGSGAGAAALAHGGTISQAPAEARALLRARGWASRSPDGVTEWLPATSSVIDAAGGHHDLAARLAAEYVGAVPATEVRRLVRHVVDSLEADHVAPARLLDVAEATSRRQLTDLIARSGTWSS